MYNYFDIKRLRTGDWYHRTKIAVDVINNCSSFKYIYDFGCGDGIIRYLIPSYKKYYGYDYHKLFNSVHQIDFNTSFPDIIEGNRKNRLCVCLGFFEYICNLDLLLKNISNNFDFLLFSYVKDTKYISLTSSMHKKDYIEVQEIVDKHFCKTKRITRSILETGIYFSSVSTFDIKIEKVNLFKVIL